METEGQKEFMRMTRNALAGLCPCGRVKLKTIGRCCLPCKGYGRAHSGACGKRNPERELTA